MSYFRQKTLDKSVWSIFVAGHCHKSPHLDTHSSFYNFPWNFSFFFYFVFRTIQFLKFHQFYYYVFYCNEFFLIYFWLCFVCFIVVLFLASSWCLQFVARSLVRSFTRSFVRSFVLLLNKAQSDLNINYITFLCYFFLLVVVIFFLNFYYFSGQAFPTLCIWLKVQIVAAAVCCTCFEF